MLDSENRLDWIGVGLGAAFAGWTLIVSLLVGGQPGPMAALGLAAVLAAVAGAWLSRVRHLVVPILVASAPIPAMLLYEGSPAGGNVLGYANASGALFFLAACGAVMVGASVQGIVAKCAAYLVAATWIFVPWHLEAHTAAVLAASIPVAVAAGRSARWVRGLSLALAGLTVVGVLATATLGGLEYRPSQRDTIIDTWFSQSLDEVRVVLWGEAVELIQDHPITGVGPDAFRERSATAQADIDLQWAHNEYLQVAAETGLPGGILLLTLVGWGFARLWGSKPNPRSVPSIVALGGVCLHANVDYIWHYAAVPLVLGLLVGAGSVAHDEGRPGAQPTLRSPTRVLTFSTLALWSILFLPIPAISPVATVQNGATWETGGAGIRFVTPGMLRSLRAPTGVLESIVDGESFTVEVWAASRAPDQAGPARIVSVSDGISVRNFTLGQEGDRLIVRLRTTETNLNGQPQIEVPGVFASADLRHLVVTRGPRSLGIYIDGEPRMIGDGPPGSLDNWEKNFPLLLGNESSGDRPWLGDVHLLALYDTVLDQTEVAERFARGPAPLTQEEMDLAPAPLAHYPFASHDGGRIIEPGGTGSGPYLIAPRRIPAPGRGPSEALFDPGGNPLLRLLAHLLSFGAWAGVIRFVPHPRPPAKSSRRMILGGGGAIAVAATVLRYLAGRSPAVWDLVGASIGCAVVLMLGSARGSEQPRSNPGQR